MKKIIRIIIGIAIFILSPIILTVILGDEELGFFLGEVLFLIYLFSLSLLNLIKENKEYKVNGENTKLELLAYRLLVGTILVSNKNVATTLPLIDGVTTANKELQYNSKKILVFNLFLRIIYWIFLICMVDLFYTSSFEIGLHVWAEYTLLGLLCVCCIIVCLVAIKLINSMNKDKSGYLLISFLCGIIACSMGIPSKLYLLSVTGIIISIFSLTYMIVRRVIVTKNR